MHSFVYLYISIQCADAMKSIIYHHLRHAQLVTMASQLVVLCPHSFAYVLFSYSTTLLFSSPVPLCSSTTLLLLICLLTPMPKQYRHCHHNHRSVVILIAVIHYHHHTILTYCTCVRVVLLYVNCDCPVIIHSSLN